MRFIYLILIILVSSCSQFSKSPTSKAWHNLNARYNALLIAREDYNEAAVIQNQNRKENYSNVLPVFPQIDSNKLDSAKFYLQDAIKKSSIIAERHSNSKHLDEAYILLGKSRLEKQEFFNAIETFKYVNTLAKSENNRSEALIWLMRSYIENADLTTADQVSDILKNRKLNKANKSLYYITKAYWHQKNQEYPLVVVYLEEGLKNLKKGRDKARLHFICAQLYENLDQRVAARKNYNQVLKNRPDYNLEFHAKLGLLSSESLGNNTENLFKDFLGDRKNQDSKSRIYLKMGEIEIKKQNFEAALNFFQKAAINANDDNQLKGLAYLATGQVYFDHLKEFEHAAVYFDSTIITLPKETAQYQQISEKALSLNDIIKYIRAYQLEDSLQKLSAMNPLELEYKLTEMVKEKNNKAKTLEQNSQPNTQKNLNTISTKDRWVLYDPVESVKANNEFVRIWGNRKLEDHWRRAEKTLGSFSLKIENSLVEVGAPQKTNETKNSPMVNPVDEEKNQIDQEVKEMLRKIPRTNVQLLASKRKQEESLYQLGKIYKLRFKDDKNAKVNFDKLITDFPQSVYEPEVLYFLSLMEPDVNNNKYSQKLVKEYPFTSYSRQIKKGNVTFSKDKESEVQAYYSDVFKIYDSGDYKTALEKLENGLNQYTGSILEDKLAMLRLLTLQKLGLKDQYVISLNDFIRSYPTSDLTVKARSFLEVLK